MYSDMSIRTIACSESNMNSASARASSVLPTPVGPMNRNAPIGRLGSWSPPRERRSALGALGLSVGLLEPLLGLADRLDGVLLGLPLGLHPGRALAQLGQLAVDRVAARHGGLVLLLLQSLELDLELLDPALDLVDLGR